MTEILGSQCPGVFTEYSHHILTFENMCLYCAVRVGMPRYQERVEREARERERASSQDQLACAFAALKVHPRNDALAVWMRAQQPAEP